MQEAARCRGPTRFGAMQREAKLVALTPQSLPPQSPFKEVDGLEPQKLSLQGGRGHLEARRKLGELQKAWWHLQAGEGKRLRAA